MKKFLLLSLFTVLVICANASDKLTGIRRLNPTTVEVLSADGSRMTIRFKALRKFQLKTVAAEGMLVDKFLNTKEFK